MSISDDQKIDLEQIVSEFIQYTSIESANKSTDPSVARVKVIKPDGNDCPCCRPKTQNNK